ncbi:MAG: alpha/beta fold hydrolase [Bacteroidota bacterium]
MPLLPTSYQKRPWYLINQHWETIVPSLFYKVKNVHYERERLELEDGDFLDLDWVRNGSKKLMILSHGLEGSASRHYIKRPAQYFSQKGWDVLAWNNRSCSGEMNRLPRFYHHGVTVDLAAVVEHGSQGYDEVVLMGYSMGGGIQQKYLGERKLSEKIKGAVSFSVPCNVLDSANQLRKKENQFYERRFIKRLKKKILLKAQQMEMPIDLEEIRQVRTFRQLDQAFSLKIHTEYEDADDFYAKISNDQYLPNVKVPLLILNAKNDPMLGDKCYPVELAKTNKYIHLEMPEVGGHIGFTVPSSAFSYMEHAAERFIEEVIFQPLSQTAEK